MSIPNLEISENKVLVSTKRGSYDVLIGANLFYKLDEILNPIMKRKRLMVITDSSVAKFHLQKLLDLLKSNNIVFETLILEPGEKSKSWEQLVKTSEWILKNKVERDDLVLAFGGGVIGDLVGFACAIVRRGIGVIQMPTTLLAQVDSSVGGKTGINSINGKNLIGSFHQPTLVISDTKFLTTLSKRDTLSGYGEILKYGLLADEKFFAWLEEKGEKIIAGSSPELIFAITRSCQIKAKIVSLDETEKGERALLNLGHTFGHALETFTGYSKRLLHGEAVSIGCMLAIKMSEKLKLCAPTEVLRLRNHLKKLSIKQNISEIRGTLPSAEELIKIMFQDKKVKNNQLIFILLNHIGNAFIADSIETSIIIETLEKSIAGNT